MALPNKPKGELAAVVNPEIVEHSCDVLIVGGWYGCLRYRF